MDEQSLNLESTTSSTENVVDSEGTQVATAPQEQPAEDETKVEGVTSTDDGGNEPTEPFLTIQYNHEDRNLTQDEAKTLAQKGVAYDSMYKTISRAAALKGVDVKTFIESFEKAQDEAYRQELIDKYGEDDMETVDTLMEVYQSKKENTIKTAEEAEQQKLRDQQTTLESRLATEFIELQKEFPEIDKFDKLPNAVKTAAANGQDLLSAYLRFKHSEQKKIDAANKSQQAAKNSSTGSLSSGQTSQSATMDAFMKGLYG